MKTTMKNFNMNIKEENNMYANKMETMVKNGAIAPKYEDTVAMSGIDFERQQSIASLEREIEAAFDEAVAGLEEVLNITEEIIAISKQ